MEERPPIWKVGANILNKQSQTAARGGSPAWELGEMLTIPHRKKLVLLQNINTCHGPGMKIWYDLSNEKET